jgi:hypothetical protein
MSSAWTVRQAVDRAVAHGLVDATVQVSGMDDDLSYYDEPDNAAAVALLDELGIVYTIDYKTFRGAHELGLDLYRPELERLAGCTRGLLTIADAKLIDEDRFHLLRFRCNGEQQEWRIHHGADEDFYAHLAFTVNLTDLVPAGSPARWCSVELLETGDPAQYAFGEPQALRQFGAEFGLAFDPV